MFLIELEIYLKNINLRDVISIVCAFDVSFYLYKCDWR